MNLLVLVLNTLKHGIYDFDNNKKLKLTFESWLCYNIDEYEIDRIVIENIL